MPAPGRAAVESVPAEVEQVVNLVAEHALTRPELSLGVVALNARHAEEIRSAVSAETAKSLALEKFCAAGIAEPFVVVDLDGARSLRRDHVILSVGYAKTPHGRTIHTFDSISGTGGMVGLVEALCASRDSTAVVSCLAAEDLKPSEILTADIISARGRTVRPKTLNQKRYVDAIDRHTVVFGIGPAGTGKTYLAMAKAVQALQSKQVSRIILTRPAIEAGERLGFLPGTLNDKIDPYLRPLYDALHDMVEADSVPKLLTSGTIEVAPLAYMRGRTLNDAFIILDEAQNTSSEQMKMFLTRLGFGSKVVVTGDITQIDLPGGVRSGLRQVTQILDGVEDIAFCTLTARDVVRHKLVGRIVAAYDSYDSIQQGRGGR